MGRKVYWRLGSSWSVENPANQRTVRSSSTLPFLLAPRLSSRADHAAMTFRLPHSVANAQRQNFVRVSSARRRFLSLSQSGSNDQLTSFLPPLSSLVEQLRRRPRPLPPRLRSHPHRYSCSHPSHRALLRFHSSRTSHWAVHLLKRRRWFGGVEDGRERNRGRSAGYDLGKARWKDVEGCLHSRKL